MSLVENLVNQISTNGLGGVTKPQGFDMNDDSFAKILQGITTGQNSGLNENLQAIGNMGQPAGMIIEPFDGTSAVQPITQEGGSAIDSEPVQIKDVDLGTDYFSNLLKESPREHKILMNVAQKHAANLYTVFNKNLVENLSDFASDVKSLM